MNEELERRLTDGGSALTTVSTWVTVDGGSTVRTWSVCVDAPLFVAGTEAIELPGDEEPTMLTLIYTPDLGFRPL